MHMAKAIFHKSQRVYVKPIGTWAHIEQVIPKWAQGISEPIKIHYDIGMGRPFMADELEAEEVAVGRTATNEGEWRILRGQNKWRSADECQHHPYPGTHPLIATGDLDWGGWRVPGTEYDRDPNRVEQQALLIAKAPVLAGLLTDLVRLSDEMGDELPSSIAELGVRARKQLIDAGVELANPSPHDMIDEHAPVESADDQRSPRSQATDKIQADRLERQDIQHPAVNETPQTPSRLIPSPTPNQAPIHHQAPVQSHTIAPIMNERRQAFGETR